MNILYIFDIHFGRNYPENGIRDSFEKHDEIIDGIIDKVAEMPDALKPEHVVFTGDITWNGNSKEYTEALDWFRRLLKGCNLTGKDITFCVGNHDVDFRCQFEDRLTNANDVDAIDDLYRYENIDFFEDCLHTYNDFCKQLGVIPYTYPTDGKRQYSYSVGYKDVTFENGKTIRIIGMDTALLRMQKKIPKDNMVLGKEQVRSLISYGILPAGDDIWYTIGLFHHSDRFLHPNETSSYDGRMATLPYLMSYLDLMACGHTESEGRPRLRVQQGGGTMLLGGAAYYNDEHINSFAMLYISEKKRGMGYIPYVYEGEWNDCEIIDYQDEITHRKYKYEKPDVFENVELVFEKDDDRYTVTFDFAEADEERKWISSAMDTFNDFSMEYDEEKSDRVSVSCTGKKKRYAKTMLSYVKLVKFIDKHPGLKCRLYDENGDVIKEFSGVDIERLSGVDESLLRDVARIEDYYDARFVIPDLINVIERAKIELLIKAIDEKEVIKELLDNNLLFIERRNYAMRLFNVNVWIPGKIDE